MPATAAFAVRRLLDSAVPLGKRLLNIPGLLIAIGTLVRLPQLTHSLNEMHAFRQTQTALAARTYAEGSINLLHTPIPVFGRSGDVPFEFPLVQAAAALLIRLGVSSDAAVRLLNLTGFQASALLLFLLVRRWHGRRVALIALALFEFLPFGLAWGAASLIEFVAVALALAMVVGLDRWFADRSRGWLVVGAVGAWLAFLVKSTTAPGWCLLVMASAAAVVIRDGWRPTLGRITTGLAAGPGIGLALAWLWTRHADAIKSSSPYTDWLTSSALREWNFGTIDQRLDVRNYQEITWRLLDEMVGPTGVLAAAGLVCLALARTWPETLQRLSWALAALVPPLVFFNLYVRHNYYLSAVFAAVVVIAAFGIDLVVRLVAGDRRRAAAGAAAILILVLLARTGLSAQGARDIGQWAINEPVPSEALAIAAATDPDDQIIMFGCDWNPLLPYYADRTVLMVKFGDSETLDGHEIENISQYSYIYGCRTDLRADDYLPAGVSVEPTNVERLMKLVHDRG